MIVNIFFDKFLSNAGFQEENAEFRTKIILLFSLKIPSANKEVLLCQEKGKTCISAKTADGRDDILNVAPCKENRSTEDCYAEELTCGKTEHTHTTECLIDTTRGYTRYGDWAGDKYAAWSVPFAEFCMYYSGVPSYVCKRRQGGTHLYRMVSWRNANL